MVVTNALEDVFNTVVELSQEGGSGGFLTNGGLSVGDIPLQC